MPRSGGRLNLTGALNRNMPHNRLQALPPTDTASKHASVCRLERELKILKEENDKLKVQLGDARSTLEEITTEASWEKFDERRVNMLKMQLIQQQRQVLLLSEALGSRSTALTEVENVLAWLLEKFRHYIGLEVRGSDVPVSRSDLMTMVDASESARIKLFKNIENCGKENLAHPQMFMNEFLKPEHASHFTMLDSCLARSDCLSLKHVTQLESKLSCLYRELVKASEALTAPTPQSRWSATAHMSTTQLEHDGTVVLRAAAMARDCAADLLSLSLLFPSAPWPPLKRPEMATVTYESLLPSMPALPRGKAAEVQHCVSAALKVCNHHCHMRAQEASALREEVRFHQAVYQLQLDYVLQTFDALGEGYKEFERSTNELLIQPMKKLMKSYAMLKGNSSGEGLRNFLTILKENEQQWTDIIQKLDTTDARNESGSVALSAFGHEFLASLDRLISSRQSERDKIASQKEELKQIQQRLEQGLRKLIKDGQEQQKIANELKGAKEGSTIPGTGSSDFLPMSSVRSENQAVDDQLGPWTDSQSQSKTGVRKPRKTQRVSSQSRKPWDDGTVLSAREDGCEKSTRESSPGLGPWPNDSKESLTCDGSKAGSEEPAVVLRPWLDESYAAEEDSQRSRRRRRKESGNNKQTAQALSGFANQGLWPAPTETETQAVRGLNSPDLHGNNTDRQSNNADRKHSDAAHGLSLRQSEVATGSELKSGRPGPGHRESGVPPVEQLASLPPDAAGKKKGTRKPRNYEPKLFVANRTLSLRRSDSLTKLSEPSLEERMGAISVSSQSDGFNTGRSGGRQSSR